MNRKRIFIWGLPGSGKTTLGETWARILNLPFADLDWRIERRHGPIPEIFAQYGHWEFRRRERAELYRMVNDLRSGVMAVGGGTPCFFDNADFMNAVGATVWLKVAPETAAKRIAGAKRPLFFGRDPVATMRRMLQEREIHYRKAHTILSL
ncbi:MAG: shikimate kinase [Bacteroidia bacterium]|nr:shikimate kinase [Bacteroidia bacterium]MDW8333190.1 shikimate kinase [Bacteroidia bacterium]